MKIFTPVNFMESDICISESESDISNLEIRKYEILNISTMTKLLNEIIKIEKSYSPFTENNYSLIECLSLHC